MITLCHYKIRVIFMIKQIIKNVIALLCAWFIVLGIVFAAWTLTKIDSWKPITKENWDAMVDEITALKSQVTSWWGIVSEITWSPKTIPDSNWVTWTMEDLVIWKPLIIWVNASHKEDGANVFVKIIDWSDIWKLTSTSSSAFYLTANPTTASQYSGSN